MKDDQSAEIASLRASLTDAEERIELLERIVTASVILIDDSLRRFALDLDDQIGADVRFHGKLPSVGLRSKIADFRDVLDRCITKAEREDRARLRGNS